MSEGPRSSQRHRADPRSVTSAGRRAASLRRGDTDLRRPLGTAADPLRRGDTGRRPDLADGAPAGMAGGARRLGLERPRHEVERLRRRYAVGRRRSEPDDASAPSSSGVARVARPVPTRLRFGSGLVRELLHRDGVRPDSARVGEALVLALIGCLLFGVAGVSDNYLHRGVETSVDPPYVVQPVGDALATNEDLLALDAGTRETTIEQMAASGMKYVRMPVRWAEIEQQPGEFNWDPLDQTLTALSASAITPVVTVVESPEWARNTADPKAADAPPADARDMYGFIQGLTTRFAGRLPFLQIWDAPNDPAHWGGQTPDPVAYATLLGESANAARQSDPGVRIVLAELAQNPADGPDDISYLRALYRSGAADFFDVVAAISDGGSRSPFDREVSSGRVNLSRVELIRAAMIEEGDPATPIWSTHFGWASGPGGVSPQEQAEYTVAARRRMRDEWPWMGLAFAWEFTPSSPGDRDRALMVDDQPTATLQAVSAYGASMASTATTGYTPLNAGSVALKGQWSTQDVAPEYQSSPQVGSTVTITFVGTGLIANVQYGPAAGLVRVQLDGGPAPGLPADGSSNGTASTIDLSADTAFNVSQPIVTGLQPATHTVTMELIKPGRLTVGGLIVIRDLPTLWPVVVLAVAGAAVLFIAIRELLYVLALRRGHLRRRRQIEISRADQR